MNGFRWKMILTAHPVNWLLLCFVCFIFGCDAAPPVVDNEPDPFTAPSITTFDSFALVDTGKPYFLNIYANGKPKPFWGARGLSPGLTIDLERGLISGTTHASGEYDVTIFASNTEGFAIHFMVFTVGYLNEFTWSGGNLNNLKVGDSVSWNFSVTGSPLPRLTAFTLPVALSFATSSSGPTTHGVVSGTLTTAGEKQQVILYAESVFGTRIHTVEIDVSQ